MIRILSIVMLAIVLLSSCVTKKKFKQLQANHKNYKQNIKTYRLYDQDLYNIDLEDKEAYIQPFDGVRSNSNDAERELKKPVDIYVIALVVGVSLVLTGLSVYILYSLNTNMTNIS